MAPCAISSQALGDLPSQLLETYTQWALCVCESAQPLNELAVTTASYTVNSGLFQGSILGL